MRGRWQLVEKLLKKYLKGFDREIFKDHLAISAGYFGPDFN